jgi:hypothetical protein
MVKALHLVNKEFLELQDATLLWGGMVKALHLQDAKLLWQEDATLLRKFLPTHTSKPSRFCCDFSAVKPSRFCCGFSLVKP